MVLVLVLLVLVLVVVVVVVGVGVGVFGGGAWCLFLSHGWLELACARAC